MSKPSVLELTLMSHIDCHQLVDLTDQPLIRLVVLFYLNSNEDHIRVMI